MKKIFSSIFILVTIASLFAPFSVNLQDNKITPSIAEAGPNCKFVSGSFNPFGQQEKGWRASKPVVNLTIETLDCIGYNLYVKLYEHDSYLNPNDLILQIDDKEISDNKLVINLNPGEYQCNGGDCKIVYKLIISDENHKNIITYKTKDTDSGKEVLIYDCVDKNKCAQSEKWSEINTTGAMKLGAIEATIDSGKDTLTIHQKSPDLSQKKQLIETTDQISIGIHDASGNLLPANEVGGTNPLTYNVLTDLMKNGNSIQHSTTFKGLKPSTTYNIKIKPLFTRMIFISVNNSWFNLFTEQNIAGTTLDANDQNVIPNESVGVKEGDKKDRDPVLPACSMNPFWSLNNGSFTGCLLQAFYTLVFEPTSWLFSKAGQFFDNVFAYSISDASYRTGFVVGGWGIVRDICNVFFIFVLLYVAFSTILNIHGFKTKEMIINVVLIGVFINFSLFTTQVIIDTSNILARVFYNSEKLKREKKEPDQTLKGEKSQLNEISLSAALVSIVDPQKILDTKESVSNEGNFKTKEADNTTWFITILMASILNVVGFITFLIVGLLFIARVIGLWIAMVVVPFAFFSYTVPAMQGMDTLGWKKWWPETLKMAFMAPVFMFFIYILLRFVEKGFNMVADSQGTGATGSGMLAVIIPFLFIMIFLIKAKDMAKSFSGSIGEGITKAAGAIAGVAMGGAALVGGATIGRLANKIGNSDKLNNLASGKNSDGTEIKQRTLLTSFKQKAAIFGKKATNAGSKGSFDFRQTGLGNALSQGTGLDLNKYTGTVGLGTKNTLGGYVGTQQKKIEKEEKFAKTLGYDHHLEEELADEVSDKEDALAAYKANEENHKDPGAYKASVAAQENAIKKLKKDQERVKTGREKEYHLYKRRQSGRLFENVKKDENGKVIKGSGDVYRDDQGNIKKIGSGTKSGKQAGKQIVMEFMAGFAKGAAIGVIGGPGAMAAVGLISALRQSVIQYSGTTNRKIGDAHNHVDKFEDHYKAPAADSHTNEHHVTESHDDGDHKKNHH